MKVGDSVVFKKRVRDYATGLFKISGWQGRIVKMFAKKSEQKENTGNCIVEYDSITLKEIPKEYLRQYLKRKLDFRYNKVALKYLEKVSPRDTEKELKDSWAELDLRCNFMSILEVKKKEDFVRKIENKVKMIYVPLATEEEIAENRKNMIQKNKHSFKVGDSVRIKQGVVEYHFNQFDMGGWEGRIVDIENVHSHDGRQGQITVNLDFDSITLKQLPVKFIEQCLEYFIDFRGIDTWVYNLEAAKLRDKKEDAIVVRLELDKKYDYSIRLELDEDEPEVLLYVDDADIN